MGENRNLMGRRQKCEEHVAANTWRCTSFETLVWKVKERAHSSRIRRYLRLCERGRVKLSAMLRG